jgi:hypothetical protein
MTNSELAAIEARANAAQAGEWTATSGRVTAERSRATDGVLYSFVVGDFDDESDAAFCASARADIPLLLAEVQRLQSENARLKERSERGSAVKDFLFDGAAEDADEIDRLCSEVRRLQSENERLQKFALDTKDDAAGTILHLELEVQELRERLRSHE